MKEKTEFEKFSEATKHIMGVSKEEFQRREAEWRKQREQHGKAFRTVRRASSRASSGGKSRDS